MKQAFWFNTPPETKARCFVPVDGAAALPAAVVRGAAPGRTVLITAGIHSAEYVGIQAAMELADELEPAAVCGCVIILPVVNRTGFEHRTMSVVHEDGKNLNRLFPGDPDGTPGDRIAWMLSACVFPHIDCYIDLHSGDGFEELTPYIYCQGAADAQTARRSREVAMQADVPYLVASSLARGGAYNHAGSMGIPGVLLERGGMGCWSRAEVDADKKDVRNMLRFLGVLGGVSEPRIHTPADVGTVIYETAPATGCWYPAKRAGQPVARGELLGSICDYHGRTLAVCRARQDGVLLYQTATLNILQDTPMVAYGQRPRTEERQWN